MKALLVYPKYPFGSMNYKTILRFSGKKTQHPPMGLLTAAALLPKEWDKKFIDMNVNTLSDKDILWADYVFVGTSMVGIQKEAIRRLIRRCKRLKAKVVGGGAFFKEEYDWYDEIDHIILNEAEITLPLFLEDLKKGQAKHIYRTDKKADMTLSPIPAWDLVNLKEYCTVAIQYSRGCPYDCEFCSVVANDGRVVRSKTSKQVLDELDHLVSLGWFGYVTILDDNILGNKKKLKEDLLPSLIEWQEKNRNIVQFYFQSSVDIANDLEILDMLYRAGFREAFIGFETTSQESLAACGKTQNLNVKISDVVKILYENGIRVLCGVVVGFDTDTPAVFDDIIEEIQDAGIPRINMVLLKPIYGTRLHKRLKKEGRLLENESEDGRYEEWIRFEPKMEKATLSKGFLKIINTLYNTEIFYERLKTFINLYKPSAEIPVNKIKVMAILTLILYTLGIKDPGRKAFWKTMEWCKQNHPESIRYVIYYALVGYEERKYYGIPSK